MYNHRNKFTDAEKLLVYDLQKIVEEAAKDLFERRKIRERIASSHHYGSLDLMENKTIKKYFNEKNISKMADIVLQTSQLLFIFRNEFNKTNAVTTAMKMLNLAIESGVFRSPDDFSFHKRSYLHKIVNLKNFMMEQEPEILKEEVEKKQAIAAALDTPHFFWLR